MVVDTPAMTPAPIHGPAALPGMVTVRPALMNLRSGPGLNFAITGQVTAGHRLHVRGSSNGWYYVEQPNGNYGWAMINLTYAPPGEPAVDELVVTLDDADGGVGTEAGRFRIDVR